LKCERGNRLCSQIRHIRGQPSALLKPAKAEHPRGVIGITGGIAFDSVLD
jgi:hypothetical protein